MKQNRFAAIPKYTSANVGAFKAFFAFGKRFLTQIISERRNWFILVIVFDAISAASKIAAVFIVALAVKILANTDKTYFDMLGIQIPNNISLIIFLGIALGVCLLVGAILLYQSRLLTRAIGRWVNHSVLDEVYEILNQPAEEVAKINFPRYENINAMLTQVPIHSGLAAETIIRLLNPMFLLAFACISLLYQQPFFASLIFATSLLFLPIVIKFSRAVQSNSQSFYSNKSADMGNKVSSMVNLAINQSGVLNKTYKNLSQEEAIDAFYNSYDTNLLANEKVAVIISIADAMMRSLIFILLCVLVYFGEFTAGATVVFLGVLVYMLASARNVAALTTNLLRYYPQTRRYLELLEAKKSSNEQSDFASRKTALDSTEGIQFGETALMACPYPLTKLFLKSIVDPLISSGHVIHPDLHGMRFVSASYQFHDATILEHLIGAQSGKKIEEEALKLAKQFNADKSFRDLQDKYQTRVNRSIWESLTPEAQLALRCIPLLINSNQTLIFMDYDLLLAVETKLINKISKLFSNCKLVITMSKISINELPNARWFLSMDENNTILSGDKKWFKKQLLLVSQNQIESGDSIGDLETLM